MRASIRSFLTALALLGMTGCLLMDSNLTLDHVPGMDAVATQPASVFLARVSDRRADRGRIGCKKSGYGSESAELHLDVKLTDWFGGVMNEELKRAGLAIAGPEDSSAVRVEVDLLDFFIEPDAGMFTAYTIHALVHAEVTVRFADGTGYARKFAALNRDSAILPTDGSYEEVMQEAMTTWMQTAVTELIRLIDYRKTQGAWRSLRLARGGAR